MYAYDSRKVVKGDVFLCLPGGDAYKEEALKRGAREILTVSRKEMAHLANQFYEFPSNNLKVIGVTGTNGKSSVCHFVTQALNQLGEKAFIQGTLSHNLTTPESLDTFSNMHQHLMMGGTYFVMEVSSHGIAQQRIAEINFDVKCLTNISQDHLDFHKTMEAYRQVKYDFMDELACQKIFPHDFQHVELEFDNFDIPDFEILNKKAALAILLACGFDYKESVAVLTSLAPPKGRFEVISSHAPFSVVVDYAHSPNGVEVVLNSARKQVQKRGGSVLVCYGCGGDRDRKKRPMMAEMVSKLADYSIITMDNPRTEEPEQIVNDMVSGINSRHHYEVILDRKKAIETLCLKAKDNDMVLVIGKGHESYQIIGETSFPFSDSEVLKAVLTDLGY